MLNIGFYFFCIDDLRSINCEPVAILFYQVKDACQNKTLES